MPPKVKWKLTDAAAKRIVDKLGDSLADRDYDTYAMFEIMQRAIHDEGVRSYDCEEKFILWCHNNDKHSLVAMVAADAVRRYKDLRKCVRSQFEAQRRLASLADFSEMTIDD